MPLTNLNVGAAPNDGTGDTLRSGGQKINTNYTFTVTTDTTQTITGTKTFTQTVTGGKFAPTANTVAGNGMYLADTNTLAFSTNGAHRMRITSAGVFGFGTTSPSGAFDIVEQNVNRQSTVMNVSTFSANEDADKSQLVLRRSRTNTINGQGLVANGNGIGSILFQGSDGVAFRNAAEIRVSADAVTGSGDMPGRIEFLTTPDGSIALQERMRITSAGAIQLPSGSPGITTATNADLLLNPAGTGKVGIGTTSPQNTLDVRGTLNFLTLSQSVAASSTTNTDITIGTQAINGALIIVTGYGTAATGNMTGMWLFGGFGNLSITTQISQIVNSIGEGSMSLAFQSSGVLRLSVTNTNASQQKEYGVTVVRFRS